MNAMQSHNANVMTFLWIDKTTRHPNTWDSGLLCALEDHIHLYIQNPFTEKVPAGVQTRVCYS